MDSDRWREVKALFELALEEPGGRRGEFVRARASRDAELAREVESLLACNDAMGDFLEPAQEDDLRAGDRVGEFTLVAELGRGGMGTVWRAEQAEPRREVALKLLRADSATGETLRRFRREAGVLARLTHPAIAQVHEAGTSVVRGVERPWFAMELVDGRPIDERARELGLRERVALVAEVCDALQHAHERGIVHRDLKPANVLVGRDGRPKVLDFGVARLVEGADSSLCTRDGLLVGTLAYMSPEQLAGDARRIDARSDVYALGALLYELATGRRAHAVDDLAVPEAARRIAEEEPPAPSSLDRRLRGDFETIVVKAMEKDRERRYARAADLASDLRAFLADRPIAARPPSTVYQLGKFARRHRGLVVGLAAAVLCLVLGLAGTTRGLLRARTAESAAEGRRVAAEASATRATEVQGFLEGVLASIDPDVARGADTTLVRRMLDDAAERIEGRFATQPLVEASLRTTLGRAYECIALYGRAVEQHERALALLVREEGATQALRAAHTALGSALMQRTEFAAAEARFRAALELAQDDRAARGRALHDLARAVGAAGRIEEALGFLAAAEAAFDARSAERVLVHEARGELLLGRGDVEGASAELAKALALDRELHAEPSTRRIACLNALAMLHWRRRDLDAAARALDDALAAGRKLLRAPHPTLAMQLSNLGMLRFERGDLAGAAEACNEAVEQSRALGLVTDLAHATRVRVLALVEKHRGEHARSEALYREALALEDQLLPPDDPGRVETLFNLGQLLAGLGRADETRELWSRALAISERAGGAATGHAPVIRAELAALEQRAHPADRR